MAAIKPNSGNLLRSSQITLMIIFCMRMLHAQNVTFKPLRYEEDYSNYAHDSTDNFYKKIKYIPLGANQSYLSLGGEMRYQYFYYKNPGWGTEPEDHDGFVLSRLLSHADLHIGKHFRVFGQIQSSMIAGSNGQTSPVDDNPLDIHQLFLDVDFFTKEDKNLVLKIGRQELSYGSQRLISVREGPNNRQAFDAFRLVFTKKNLLADAFYSTYVNAGKDVFDERFFNRSNQLWGSYVVLNQKNHRIPNLDLYYFGVKNDAIFVDGIGKETRHSNGTRIWKKDGIIDYDFETVYQFGKLSEARIKAWTVSLNLSFPVENIPFTPVIGVKTELISGDRKYDDRRINTFNPLYPKGAYFGLASLIGPYNLSDLHPYIQIDIGRKATWSADFDFFWRMSRNDGLYAVNGNLIHDGRNIHAKKIGNQLGTEVSIQANAFLFFRLEFTRFDAGKFLRLAGMGKDIYMAGITATIKY
jgi:hypothetical protein